MQMSPRELSFLPPDDRQVLPLWGQEEGGSVCQELYLWWVMDHKLFMEFPNFNKASDSKLTSVFGFNAVWDPDPAFISIRIQKRIQGVKPKRIRIRILVRLKCHKKLILYMKNIFKVARGQKTYIRSLVNFHAGEFYAPGSRSALPTRIRIQGSLINANPFASGSVILKLIQCF